MPTQHRYNIYCSAVLSAWDTHLDGARFPYSAPQLSSRMGIYHTIHSLVVNSLKARAMTYLIFVLPRAMTYLIFILSCPAVSYF